MQIENWHSYHPIELPVRQLKHYGILHHSADSMAHVPLHFYIFHLRAAVHPHLVAHAPQCGQAQRLPFWRFDVLVGDEPQDVAVDASRIRANFVHVIGDDGRRIEYFD